jgi:hypothetical protein
VTKKIKISEIREHAIDACRCFSEFEKRFFNFPKRQGWAGWENWFTIELVRRINSSNAIAFLSYPSSNKKFDISINNEKIAIEIKVTYISKSEVVRWAKKKSKCLSSRLYDDAKKLRNLPSTTTKLLFLAAVFESNDLPMQYTTLVSKDVSHSYREFRSQWFDCSSGDGCIWLLVMENKGK